MFSGFLFNGICCPFILVFFFSPLPSCAFFEESFTHLFSFVKRRNNFRKFGKKTKPKKKPKPKPKFLYVLKNIKINIYNCLSSHWFLIAEMSVTRWDSFCKMENFYFWPKRWNLFFQVIIIVLLPNFSLHFGYHVIFSGVCLSVPAHFIPTDSSYSKVIASLVKFLPVYLDRLCLVKVECLVLHCPEVLLAAILEKALFVSTLDTIQTTCGQCVCH